MSRTFVFCIPVMCLACFFLGIWLGMTIEGERNPQPIISTTTP